MKNTKQLNLTRVACMATLTSMALMGAGCASIVHGGPRTVTVSTVPSGAKATLTKAVTGEVVSVNTTPFTVALEPKRGFFKGQSYKIKLELPGYTTTDVELKATLTGWYWGNILLGGVIGMLIVDPATGSMWNLSPDKIEQPLTASQASLIKSGNGFVVMLASQLTEGERAGMVRIN